MYKKVIVSGSIAFDNILDFPGVFTDFIQADKIHNINVSFHTSRLEKQIGGTATNIAYSINYLEKGKTVIVGGIGKDGQPILDWMESQGFSSEFIVVDKEDYTALATGVADQNHNQIWSFYPGSLGRAAEVDLNDIIVPKTLVVVSATEPVVMSAAVQQATENPEADIFYDPGMVLTAIDKETLLEGVKNSKYIALNDYELGNLQKILGMTISDILDFGVNLITTLGKQGLLYQSKETNTQIPAFPDAKLVDPTGAGDAWRGGFIAGLLQNKSVTDCLVQGNVMASFAVEEYGTLKHAPTSGELAKRAKIVKSLL